jgi:hypothetical protein
MKGVRKMEKQVDVVDLRSITSWDKLNTLRLLIASPIEEVQERYHITGNNPVILENKHIPEVIIFPGHYDLSKGLLVMSKEQQRKVINQSISLLKAEMIIEGDIRKALNYIGGVL